MARTLSPCPQHSMESTVAMQVGAGPRPLALALCASQACSPLWSHECGSSYYTTGMCSRVNANFRFSKTVAPALQSK